MQNEYPAWFFSFSAALETRYFVGRDDLLEQLRKDIADPGNGVRVIIVRSPGGYGKSFLLKRLITEIRAIPQITQKQEVDVIDLYHLNNHTPDFLTNHIIENLDFPEDIPIDLSGYQAAWTELNRRRIKNDIGAFNEQSEKTLAEFLKIMKALSEKRRVVLALDTLERLVYLQEASTLRTNTWEWLLRTLAAGEWGNVTLILAGRPEAQPLFDELSARVKTIDRPVPEFNLDDRIRYFTAAKEAAESTPGAKAIAQMIDDLIEKGLNEKYAVLEGRPILLSLLIHVLCFDAFLPHPQTSLSLDLENRDTLERKVIKYLIEAPRIGATIIALGRLRKGANAELLGKVLGVSVEIARERLNEIKELSFIKKKVRGREILYFLHDEMYHLLDRHFFGTFEDEPERVKAAKQISEYYRRLIESLPANMIAYRQIRQISAEVPITEPYIMDFSQGLLDREEAMAENLYYHLRNEPVRGFRYYYRYMRNAFRTADTNFGALLIADLLPYSIKPEGEGFDEELPLSLVEGELLLYQVFRLCCEKKYDECLATIHDLEEKHPDLFSPADRLGLYANLLNWKSYCLRFLQPDLVHATETINQAAEILQGIINEWQEEDLDPAFLKSNARLWYLYSASALVAYLRASIYWSKGDLTTAITGYKISVNRWRNVDVLNELASATNDYAFALSEQGDYNAAHRLMVKSCLELRRLYGTSTQMALSLNTLGIILLKQGKYDEAIEKSCEARALAILVEDRWAEGLTLTALAEEHRRKATSGTVDQTHQQKYQLLESARQYAQEALDVFCAMQGQELRQVEALIEFGCACRDIVRTDYQESAGFLLRDRTEDQELQEKDTTQNIPLLEGQPRGTYRELDARENGGDLRDRARDQDLLILQGKEALQRAARLAGQIHNTYRELDALVDLAWLGYYSGDEDLQQDSEQQALAHLSALTYSERTATGISSTPKLYWTLLGKLYVLKGITRMSDFERSKASGDWQADLRAAARTFAEGLQYSAKFSPEYIGLRQAEDTIYDRMKKINKREMKIVIDEIEVLEERMRELRELPDDQEKKCLLFDLLNKHCLLSK